MHVHVCVCVCACVCVCVCVCMYVCMHVRMYALEQVYVHTPFSLSVILTFADCFKSVSNLLRSSSTFYNIMHTI